MSHKILPVLVLFAISLSMASCLDDEKEDLVYYDDTAITRFSIGTLNKYYTVKSSTGEDSIVKTTTDCSGYKFSIDNYANTIYNTDSLPIGIDVSKVICNISTKNSGIAVWYQKSSTGTDSLSYVSTTDSVDFTSPRELRVYNTSMTAYRKYTVSVNVHKEEADTFVWRNIANDATIANMRSMKCVCADNKIYLFGSDGVDTKVFMADDADFTGFTPISVAPYVLGADACRNIAALGNTVFVLDGTSLMKIEASTITAISANAPVSRLIGAGNNRIYGYDGNGNILYSTDGTAWEVCGKDDDAGFLPTDDINLVAVPSRTNNDTYQLTLVGNNGSPLAQVWGKVEEGLTATDNQPWSHYVFGNENAYRLPAFENLNAIRYDRSIIALGYSRQQGSKVFTPFYTSKDAGITWRNDSTITMPEGFDCSAQTFTMTVDNDYHIWIICGGSGQVWRGRLNKLGWANKE